MFVYNEKENNDKYPNKKTIGFAGVFGLSAILGSGGGCRLKVHEKILAIDHVKRFVDVIQSIILIVEFLKFNKYG